jgi:hypothetical protein
MRKLRASSLVLDFSMYPRQRINEYNASAIADAMRAGATLPPVIVERGTLRVVDGFHRVTAYRRVHNGSGSIEVEERTYKDDGALFLDAARLNAEHGQRLTHIDYARCLDRGAELGLSVVQMAGVLHLTVERVGDLTRERHASAPDGEPVLIKRSIRHKAGEVLTSPQVEANSRLSGMHITHHARQLIILIEADLVDPSNEVLAKALRDLHESLGAYLAGIRPSTRKRARK